MGEIISSLHDDGMKYMEKTVGGMPLIQCQIFLSTALK